MPDVTPQFLYQPRFSQYGFILRSYERRGVAKLDVTFYSVLGLTDHYGIDADSVEFIPAESVPADIMAQLVRGM